MLNGKQVERICAALSDAYTLDDLRQLVRYELNQRLDAIVPTSNALNKVIFDLVDWAEANDALVVLLSAAANGRPQDQTLAQLAHEVSAAQHASPPQTSMRRVDLSAQLRNPADAQPDVDTTLITWLIDRAQQTYELAKMLQRVQSTSAPRPIVCLLPGNDDECHDKFVQRIVQYQLQSLIPNVALAAPQHFLLDMPPRGYKSAADLHDFLRADLGANALASMAATTAEINARFAALRAPVVVQTLMRVEGWGSSAQQIVADFLAFWAQWPDLAAQQWILIFFCIRAQPKPKGIFGIFGRKEQDVDLDRALQDFATIGAGATPRPVDARVICAALPELEPISQEDAERWAADPKVQQVFAGRDLVSEIGRIYAARRATAIPMAALHQMLMDALRTR